MADRQTTGGYPKIGVVIGADLPLAGQLAPGDWIEFAPCTRQTAVEALRPASAVAWRAAMIDAVERRLREVLGETQRAA